MSTQKLLGREKPKIVGYEQDISPMEVPVGRILVHLAETYPDLMSTICELVQNGIDENATRIKVNVDLEERTLVVSDNGEGASKEKFKTALKRVLRTMKSGDKLGRWGIGLLSPLGKCDHYTTTFCEKDNEVAGYRKWYFRTREIETSDRDINIPSETVPNFVFAESEQQERGARKRGKTAIWWRAQVRCHRLVRDYQTTKIDFETLVETILDKFGRVMFRNGVIVNIHLVGEDGKVAAERNIVASAYTGRKLPEVVIENKDAGKVTFSLFIAHKAKGRVSFGETGNDFRIKAGEFGSQAKEIGILDTEIAEAIEGGVFEGDIVAERINLHSNRKSFVANDALVGFCIAIEEWYKKHGRGVVEENKSQNRDLFHQKAGILAMAQVEELMEKSGENFKDVFEKFKLKTVRQGDKTAPAVAEDDDSSLSTAGNPLVPKEPGEGGGGGSTDDPKVKKGPHSPTVAGPLGRPRKKVIKGGKTGLSIKCEPLTSTIEVYRFDTKSGRMAINSSNQKFGLCEKGGIICLVRYIETVMIQALLLSRYENKPTYPGQRTIMFEYLDLTVQQIVAGNTLLRKLRRRG
ncbi:MAG: hypothetical protein A3G59_01230 [Candidatus Taylorbacteria bacterium RIFCSPLOWO2_12_FULL_47_20]|uniref:Histidine kinase/HSP90-like ATPase domain-containing protein n=2 Tax=Candidatus Tayloriibacteriota TaxID=1817919 RepID=A0A1G2P7Z2_9BACT|nr:MAG: hypothetical protein A3H68_02460 [Candidatus Taylorbacteria bacterium RIFCSPLOWO2_02_FULL_46_40]OHA43681.1 MAG: hypothetical protein A3G59_01230 [Candidatus Taylorbacteria bacterium RIFCSPLOWO2_12_FULL_47_20]